MNPNGASGEPASPEEKSQKAVFIFDERYAEAILHKQGGHRVLGKKLKPFSAWHRTLLEWINHPCLSGEMLSPYDLLRAVQIFSLSFPNRPSYHETMWGRLIDGSQQVKIERKASKNPAWFARETRNLLLYIKDYLSPPVVMSNSSTVGEKMPEIDRTLMEVALYRHYTNCPREEAWNIAIGEMSWMNAAIAKTQGANIHIVSTLEDKMLSNIRKKMEVEKNV